MTDQRNLSALPLRYVTWVIREWLAGVFEWLAGHIAPKAWRDS